MAEWVATASGSGDFNALLALEKATNTRHLLGLHHDPFMFHQANLRQTDVASITINGNTAQYSLFQAWVETVVQEMIRLYVLQLNILRRSHASSSGTSSLMIFAVLPGQSSRLSMTILERLSPTAWPGTAATLDSHTRSTLPQGRSRQSRSARMAIRARNPSRSRCRVQ